MLIDHLIHCGAQMCLSIVSDGAAEEAGLMVGDYVLAVNGTDVTSIPHSEAANLARQGMLCLDLKGSTRPHICDPEPLKIFIVKISVSDTLRHYACLN